MKKDVSHTLNEAGILLVFLILVSEDNLTLLVRLKAAAAGVLCSDDTF